VAAVAKSFDLDSIAASRPGGAQTFGNLTAPGAVSFPNLEQPGAKFGRILPPVGKILPKLALGSEGLGSSGPASGAGYG
jgi:hypothetical protein